MTTFGAELKQARKDAGLGLRSCERPLLSSISNISKTENGHAKPTLDMAKRADTFFGTGNKFQRLFQESQTDLATAPTTSDEMIIPAGKGVDGRTKFMPTSRRGFLAGIGALAVVGATAPAVAAAPWPVTDVHPVTKLQKARKLLVDIDNEYGPGEVIPRVEGYIRRIKTLKGETRGADRIAVLGEHARFAEFNGWLYQDLGDLDTARYWMDRALEYSVQAGDPDLTTFIMARKSQAAIDDQDPIDAIGASDAALSTATPNSRLAAVAATFGAQGHALAGDADACARSYDNAHELFSTADASDPWGPWLDTNYIEVHRAQSLAALGQYSAAAEKYRLINAANDDEFHRDHGVYLARESIAHAGTRDADMAAQIGLQALAVAQETGSGRIITELCRLETTLSPASANENVRTFTSAMRDTVLRGQ